MVTKRYEGISVPLYHNVEFRAVCAFAVYEMVSGIAKMCGPRSGEDRVLKLEWRAYDREFLVLVFDPPEVGDELVFCWYLDEVPPDVEMPDPTPMEIPLALQAPPSLHDEIRRIIAVEASKAAANSGFGTMEEEDDFDVEEETDIAAQYHVPVVSMVPEGPDVVDKPERAPVADNAPAVESGAS